MVRKNKIKFDSPLTTASVHDALAFGARHNALKKAFDKQTTKGGDDTN